MPTPQFITDNTGKKLAVVLPIKEYNKLIEELEDLEDVKEFDKAMSREQEFVPFEQAIKEIEKGRKKKQNV
jgi:PHD/YefM family antitoxin component YafN of YafNO toxin-antitoxin module